MLAIRPEDGRVFFCAAQNPAGVARGNFTVRVVDSLENNSDGPETSSGGLQENTDSYNSQEQESTLAESDDMFQVNELMYFGLQSFHKGAFTNYVYKICLFLTTYLPPLVNVVCKWPLTEKTEYKVEV